MKATLLFSPVRLAVSFCLLACGWQKADGAIVVVNPAAANHIPFSICPAIDGANALNPDPVVYLPPPGIFSPIRWELWFGDTPWPGWTFKKGKALNGTLTLNTYKSVFDGAHYSGADINATYAPAATDPAGLHFMQMVTTSDPVAGATSPYIDPFPNDDNLPFYWTAAEEAAMGGGLTFSDGSRRSHPPTSFVTWRGSLYIASWDGNTPGVVTIHDGIKWGFDAGCIHFLWITVTVTTSDPTTCVLTWPTTTVPYRVETTTTLGTGARWRTLTGTVTTTQNGESQMTVPRTSEQQYFRLALTKPALVPPTIENQPEHQTNTFGSTVEIEVGATGTANLHYQWHHNGVLIPGATDSILTISNAQPAHMGEYTVMVVNEAGAVLSDPAMLTLRSCALNITSQPRSTTNAPGTTATFAVTANGFPAPTMYQWQRRSGTLAFSNIPGATNPTCAKPVTMADNGSQYRCAVGNGCATAMSAPATLTVSGTDTNVLALIGATALCDDSRVTLTFNKPLNPSSAMNPAAYRVMMQPSGEPMPVQSVQMASPTSVNLFMEQPALHGVQYVVQVQNLFDQGGQPIGPQRMMAFGCQP